MWVCKVQFFTLTRQHAMADVESRDLEIEQVNHRNYTINLNYEIKASRGISKLQSYMELGRTHPTALTLRESCRPISKICSPGMDLIDQIVYYQFQYCN